MSKTAGFDAMVRGVRVKKRGFPALGTIAKADETWATIDWDDGLLARERPLMCHKAELELVK